MENLLELRNIKFEYSSEKQSVVALDGIDLSVDKGEFVCILGPSGCGKSTLLNIIAGLVKPTSGTAKMQEEEISGTNYHRAMVFQQHALYPWLDTKENVAFGPRIRGVEKKQIEKDVERYLHLVNLTEFADSRIYELSGGMRQRVQLARVLINEPDIVLMDEPFGALDAFTRKDMQDLVRNIWTKSQNTFLLVTHDVDEALCLGTRIIVMTSRPGRIAYETSAGFTFRIKAGEVNCQFTEDYIMAKKELTSIICE